MIAASGATWQDVALALIVAIPGILAAYYGNRNAHQLKTGNDKTVGTMVTDVHGEASRQETAYDTHGGPDDFDGHTLAPGGERG